MCKNSANIMTLSKMIDIILFSILVPRSKVKICQFLSYQTEGNLLSPHSRKWYSVKILGLHFDQKLTWPNHIKILKAKCMRSINILKIISYPSKGHNRKLLLQLYRSLSRSRLDYAVSLRVFLLIS